MNSPKLLVYLGIAGVLSGASVAWITRPDPIAPESRSAPVAPLNSGIPATAAADTNPAKGEIRAERASTQETSHDLEEILTFPSDLHRQAALKEYFDQLPAYQLNQAFLAIRDNLEAEPEVGEMLFRTWAQRSPADAGKAVLTIDGFVRNRIIGAFSRAWIRQDAEAASKWIKSSLSGMELTMAEGYLRQVKPLNLTAAPAKQSLDDILAMTRDSDRKDALRDHFLAAGKVNWEKAAADAATLQNRMDRMNTLGNLFGNKAAQDPEVFLRWVEANGASHDTHTLSHPVQIAVERIFARDPVLARQLVDGFRNEKLKSSMSMELAKLLVERDPAAAADLFRAVREKDSKVYGAGFLGDLIAKEPARGGELLRSEFALQMKTKTQDLGNFIDQTMGKWIKQDPAAAAKFAVEVPAEARAEVLYAVSKEWCVKDGQEAIKWAAALPPGAVRDEALRQFTYNWAKHDSNDSTAWLSSLPKDSGRVAATEGFVFSVFDTDPDAALGWARSITDETKRLDVLNRAWRKWQSRNSRAAIDWFENAELSPSERDKIEQP